MFLNELQMLKINWLIFPDRYSKLVTLVFVHYIFICGGKLDNGSTQSKMKGGANMMYEVKSGA